MSVLRPLTLGGVFKRWREDHARLNKKQAAKASGLDRSTIARIEDDLPNRDLKSLHKLAIGLGTTLERLQELVGEPVTGAQAQQSDTTPFPVTPPVLSPGGSHTEGHMHTTDRATQVWALVKGLEAEVVVKFET